MGFLSPKDHAIVFMRDKIDRLRSVADKDPTCEMFLERLTEALQHPSNFRAWEDMFGDQGDGPAIERAIQKARSRFVPFSKYLPRNDYDE
jgi:hypothetical protein